MPNLSPNEVEIMNQQAEFICVMIDFVAKMTAQQKYLSDLADRIPTDFDDTKRSRILAAAKAVITENKDATEIVAKVLQALLGKTSEQIRETWKVDLNNYEAIRKKYLIYSL